MARSWSLEQDRVTDVGQNERLIILSKDLLAYSHTRRICSFSLFRHVTCSLDWTSRDRRAVMTSRDDERSGRGCWRHVVSGFRRVTECSKDFVHCRRQLSFKRSHPTIHTHTHAHAQTSDGCHNPAPLQQLFHMHGLVGRNCDTYIRLYRRSLANPKYKTK